MRVDFERSLCSSSEHSISHHKWSIFKMNQFKSWVHSLKWIFAVHHNIQDRITNELFLVKSHSRIESWFWKESLQFVRTFNITSQMKYFHNELIHQLSSLWKKVFAITHNIEDQIINELFSRPTYSWIEFILKQVFTV